jgi:hypothetical protein
LHDLLSGQYCSLLINSASAGNDSHSRQLKETLRRAWQKAHSPAIPDLSGLANFDHIAGFIQSVPPFASRPGHQEAGDIFLGIGALLPCLRLVVWSE